MHRDVTLWADENLCCIYVLIIRCLNFFHNVYNLHRRALGQTNRMCAYLHKGVKFFYLHTSLSWLSKSLLLLLLLCCCCCCCCCCKYINFYTDCDDLDDPSYGNVTVNGTIALIQCNPGYQLVGESNVTCLATGNWSSSNYSCVSVGKLALFNKCIPN